MKKRLIYLILPVLTLVLEALPYGALCNFALPATDGTIGRFRELYAYFDLTPFGYANFAPFLTALLSCIAVLLVILYCINGSQRMARAAKTVFLVAAILSLGPLLFGIHYFSIVGACITVTLATEFLLLHNLLKEPQKQPAQ